MTPDEAIADLQATILELREAIRQQATTIEQQTLIIEQQAIVIERLQRENAELKERLNKNSRNSSRPPSSDGLAKPSPSSLRQKSGKKPGAQKGHLGHGFSLMAPVTDTVIHKPAQCLECPLAIKCASCGRSAPRNVVDVEVTTNITRHYTEQYACPLRFGQIISGKFPEGINSSVQYGEGVRALAITLNTVGMVGIDRTHNILASVLGIPISTGTITRMVAQFGSRIMNVVQEIKEALLKSDVANCDETGTRVNGATYWLHSACNTRYTYLSLQQNRGLAGMENAGFLPFYEGTIVHDCWSAYWSFAKVKHGLCGAHLLRELQGIIDNNPKSTWAKSMQSLLCEMDHHRKEAVESGAFENREAQIAKFKRRYSIVLGKARKKNPVESNAKGRPRKGKERALIDRLIKHKNEVCRFLDDWRVPFTNNLAEQSIRMMKVKTKVSGCFRTLSGAQNYASIMSYLQTAMKHGITAYTAIINALRGKSRDTIFA